MSHLNPGLISAYNSLTDKHLAGYFSNTRIRRHLQRAGLITRSGRIVPDKEYRHKLIQRAHQRHIRECLAQAIFHKVLEMERIHQIEIKRRLEEFARRERVHKIKVERSKRYEEDIIRILSPRPPTGARGIRKQHSGPEGEHSESSESPGSSRPNTAPGKMQRPVRLKPIHSNSTTASLRRSSPYRLLEPSNENNQPFNCTMDKDSRRRLTTMEPSHGISPYCLPVINNFVTPVPPATKRKERGVKVTPSGTLRGRRLRPTTASSGADVNEEPPMLRSSMHQSRVSVNMMYFGKTVHLSHDLTDLRDEVKVFQQHCGGENLCVYKGMLQEGDTFQFISRRHRGFPFSLTFFLNGLQVERLSSCCEFKHRKGSRLGGRHGHFGFCSVEGASPCYKCIIAMGLDKKPTPPPKRVKEDGGREDSLLSPKDAPEIRRAESTAEEAASPCETSQQQDLESQVKEETAAEDKVRDDYEEDFEADDEGPAEDAEAKEEKSPSPFSETQTQVKERDASETEDYEKDDDMKSHSASSYSGSDQEESDSEAPKDSREEEKAEQPEEVDQEESVVPPDKKDEPDPEEATATEAESAVAKDSDIQNSAGDSTEIDISDTSVPSGNETKQNDDTSGDREAENIVDESKQEEEQERAKSVQEKLAEAILKESQCSSEPELSDTSTEEEEESTDKGPGQDNKDAVREQSVTFTEQQQTIVEETKCDEGVVGGAEVTQGQGETSDPKEQEDETELLPQHTNDFTKDEKVKTDEEDQKASLEESTAENDKFEDTEDTGLHPVSEEDMAEDDKTSEPQENTAAKSTDSGDEDEEKTAVKVDTQCDEAGKGAKSSKEDESSVSEPDKKTDETAAPDNAEAEAMTVSETIEMKAEPSEEREALSCEEAPVTDTDRAAASETEVTAENSSSSLEGSGDTTVEKTAETSGDNAKDEGNEDDIEEDESEEALDDRKNDNHQERFEQGEELTVKGVERDDGAEERSEEEGKEEEKQTNPDDITGGDNGEENKANEKDKTEEDENNGTKTEERLENEEEMTKSDSNTEQKADEQAEETHSEGDKVKAEESVDESEKKEKDEDGECVRDKNDIEESEEKGPETNENNEGGKFSETNPAAAEKNEDAEKQEKEQKENKAEEHREDEKNKDVEESEAKRVLTDVTVEGEEISVTTEEPEKSADADLGRDHVKISDESVVESEDVSEVADVAQGTKTPDEEAEDVKKETEKVSDNTENEEIDAENGEISTGAGNKTQEDEGDAQSEGKNEAETGEGTEGEIKTEKPTEDEGTVVKEVTMESGEAGEKCEDVKVEQAPDTDLVESDAMEGDDDAAKQDESPKNIAEPETSGVEIKEESETHDKKDCEETKQDENGNISDPGHENRDSDLIKKNDNVTDVTVASSSDREESSAPVALDLNDAAQKSDEFTEPSDSKTDKHPYTDENAAAVADASAGDGENGETEDASKASEEGASVLLKPQAQASTQVQNNEAENTEESNAVSKETPEALATEDNTDLVTNWVTMHQASKFFETFVEPLEDLKESDVQLSNSDKEAAPSAELLRSMSPLNMMKMSENAEQMPNDANDPKGEAVESELESNHCEDVEPCEKDSIKDTLNVEETEVKDLTQEAEGEENDKESVKGQDVTLEEHKERRGSPEVDKDDLMQDNIEQTDVFKTEVESIADTHHSVASGQPEKVSDTQTEEKTTDIDPDLKEKQTPVEEITDLLPSSETEECCEPLTSPGGFSEPRANNPSIIEETWEKSGEVTETTDFTEDGSQEESCHTEAHPKPSDESIKGDRRDSQLIQDFQQTLSKDQLSTFSVDETLFGRSSYPLLTAARTESGH